MLVDTSGLYCLIDADDALHSTAVTLFSSSIKRVTHNYILAELVALANARKFNRQIALAFVDDIASDPDVSVIWVDEKLHAEALDLLQARHDKTYSLCDAVSFLVMRRHGFSDALTTDRHFEQEGFMRLLKPRA